MKTAKKTITEQEVYDAIHVILKDKKNHAKTLNYAVAYCRAALEQKGDALRIQCLYILNNIAYWRHEKAKEVRATLRGFGK